MKILPNKKSVLFLLVFILVIGFPAFAQSEDGDENCDSKLLYYFPESKIASVLGIRVKNKVGYDQIVEDYIQNYWCRFNMDVVNPEGPEYPASLEIETEVREYKSVSDAQEYATQYREDPYWVKIDVGDEAYFSFPALPEGVARKDNFIFKARDLNHFPSELFVPTQAQIEELLRYAVNKISSADKQVDQPIIYELTPTTVSAGVLDSINEQTGIVSFKDNIVTLEIKGKGLNGATLTADNVGVDYEPGINFENTKTNPEGSQVYAHMVVHPTAKAGPTKITLTNQDGQSVSYEITVTITGTQYLQRVFAEYPVTFLGHWEEVAPNPRVLNLEKGVPDGLNAIQLTAYLKLGIIIHVYKEEAFQKLAPCGPNSNYYGGCSRREDNIIHVRESVDDPLFLSRTILHEATHKLNAYYRGIYVPVPNPLPNNFYIDWYNAAGGEDTSGGSKCMFLPLTYDNLWSDGTFNVPHCSFILSYGASDLLGYSEDIATLTEYYVFLPDYFVEHAEEINSDPRYHEKINLLRQYGFTN